MRVEEMVREFENMTLNDLTEFISVFKERFGVETAPQQEQVFVQTEDAPVVEEKTEFNLTLEPVADQTKKISVIKAVRELTKLGLKESKDLVDTAPNQLLTDATQEEVNEWQQKLTESGANVRVE